MQVLLGGKNQEEFYLCKNILETSHGVPTLQKINKIKGKCLHLFIKKNFPLLFKNVTEFFRM
jgi:hypothetical protein